MLFELYIFLLPLIFVWLIISLIMFIQNKKKHFEKRENAKTMLFIATAFLAGDACIVYAFMFIRWLLTTPIFRM